MKEYKMSEFNTGDIVKIRRDIPNTPYYIEAWLDDTLEVIDRYEGAGGPETSYKIGNEYGSIGPLPESWLTLAESENNDV